MNVVVTSPDYRIDEPLRGHIVRSLGAALYRFAGRIARVRVKLRAVPGRREAPLAHVRIQVEPAIADAPEVVVAHRSADPARAIARAARRAERSLQLALVG